MKYTEKMPGVLPVVSCSTHSDVTIRGWGVGVGGGWVGGRGGSDEIKNGEKTRRSERGTRFSILKHPSSLTASQYREVIKFGVEADLRPKTTSFVVNEGARVCCLDFPSGGVCGQTYPFCFCLFNDTRFCV